MEIERKFLIRTIPAQLNQYPSYAITQGYLCTEPVVRIRQKNDAYILTYKSAGMRSRIEQEMPLTKEAFAHLLTKTDGNIITKTRYLIPDCTEGLTIELDCFHGCYEGIYLAEVEFANEAAADAYLPPDWFAEEVTYDGAFHNSHMSTMQPDAVCALVKRAQKTLDK
jgi:CYTH domain-containing protein